MPARSRKETAKKRIRRTRDGRGCAPSEPAVCTHPPSLAMIADGEPNGLFRYHGKFNDYGGPLCYCGPPRPVVLRLEAVGPARHWCAAVACFRTASLYPHRTVCDDHSALFPLPPAACSAHGGAGTCRGDWHLIA